jgi:hypothetical protein
MRFTQVLFSFGVLILASANLAHAARLPNTAERNELRHAIKLIVSVGQNAAAVALLSQSLAQGTLKIEDGWNDGTQGLTNYPVRGPQTITIAAQTIPDASHPGFRGERGAPGLFEDRLWLASILVHEWLHTTQSWLYVHTQWWNIEPPAWRAQVVFLKGMRTKLRDYTLYELRADSLVDRAQFSLDLATGAVRE